MGQTVPDQSQPRTADERPRFQFSLRAAFLLTLGVSVVIAYVVRFGSASIPFLAALFSAVIVGDIMKTTGVHYALGALLGALCGAWGGVYAVMLIKLPHFVDFQSSLSLIVVHTLVGTIAAISIELLARRPK